MKEKYKKPSIRVVTMKDFSGGLMNSSKYTISVDGKNQTGGGAKEENPDEIDAKKNFQIWDSWDNQDEQ